MPTFRITKEFVPLGYSPFTEIVFWQSDGNTGQTKSLERKQAAKASLNDVCILVQIDLEPFASYVTQPNPLALSALSTNKLEMTHKGCLDLNDWTH